MSHIDPHMDRPSWANAPPLVHVPAFIAAASVLLLSFVSGRLGPYASATLMLIMSPIVLFAPGYLIVSSLNLRQRFDIEAAALCVGFSFVLVILAGFALNLIGRLDHTGWAILAAGIVYTLVRRESRFTPGEAVLKLRSMATAALRPGPDAAMLAGAAVIALAAVLTARVGADRHRQFTYTNLWAMPVRAQSLSLIGVGVKNMEKHTQAYSLDIIVGGATVSHVDVPSLAHGETWMDEIAVPMPLAPQMDEPLSGPSLVEIQLHRAGDEQTIMRRAILTLPEPVPALANEPAVAANNPAKQGVKPGAGAGPAQAPEIASSTKEVTTGKQLGDDDFPDRSLIGEVAPRRQGPGTVIDPRAGPYQTKADL